MRDDITKMLNGHVLYIIAWHYENMSMQYTAIFHGSKNEKNFDKTIDNFLIFAQNIDCGNTLEPPQ